MERVGVGMEKKTSDKKQSDARDRPIYLQVKGEHKSCLWIVIEDGRRPREEESTRQRQSSGSEDDDDKVIFRQLNLPQFDYDRFPNSLVVLNSRLYLIGGSKRTTKMGGLEPYCGYDYLDLGKEETEWRWGQEGSFAAYYQTDSVACCKDGLIYILEPRECYRMDPRGGGLRAELPSKFPTDFGTTPQLLGISDKNIYAYSHGYGCVGGSSIMVRYDLEKNEWDCLFTGFWGIWASGVVLYGDSYLLCFGTDHPTDRSSHTDIGVYVFDIRRRQWLDEPVKGLDGALPVLPDVEDKHLYLESFLPCMFQIGTHRFALVWDKSLEEPDRCELHCHKFTFDHTPCSSSSSSLQPSFVARLLSDGVLTIDIPPSRLLGCTVAM